MCILVRAEKVSTFEGTAGKVFLNVLIYEICQIRFFFVKSFQHCIFKNNAPVIQADGHIAIERPGCCYSLIYACARAGLGMTVCSGASDG